MQRLTEEALEKAVENVQIEISETLDLATARQNIAAVNVGIRDTFTLKDPSASRSKRLACKHCLTCMAGNGTRAKVHLALCSYCPPDGKDNQVLLAVSLLKLDSMTPTDRVRLQQVADINAAAPSPTMQSPKRPLEVPEPFQACSPSSKRRASKGGGMNAHVDRQLPPGTVRKIDLKFAMWIFTMALALRVIISPFFWDAVGMLNATYRSQSGLTEWNLRHELLEACYQTMITQVEAVLKMHNVLTLVSDGWSGVQKKHVLNILLCTPIPFFIKDIYTKEHSVNGEYQRDEFSAVIEERGRGSSGFWKVRALCTDNASVMKKTWRLLRATYRGFLTYGCAPHAINLHAQKLMRLIPFKKLIQEGNVIVQWFRSHHGGGGAATLERVQVHQGRRPKSMTKANQTRWNAMIDSIRSALDIKADLILVVTDSMWKEGAVGASAVKNLVLQLGEHRGFWGRCAEFITFTRAVRISNVILQSFDAKASDVYACYVAIHAALEACELADPTIKNAARELCFKRLSFIFHPVMLVAYILDPRYAKASTVPTGTAMRWLKVLGGALLFDPSTGAKSRHAARIGPENIETRIVTEFATFCASFEKEQYEDMWDDNTVYSMSVQDWWSGYAGRVNGEDGSPAWGLLVDLADLIFPLTMAASAAEGNWSDHAVVISKARNRLAPSRSIKLLYIKCNNRTVQRDFLAVKMPNNVTAVQVKNFLRENRKPHVGFEHPSGATGANLCTWGDGAPELEETEDDVIEQIEGLDEDDLDNPDHDGVCDDKRFDYDGPFEAECPQLDPDHIEALVSRQIAVFLTDYEKWWMGKVAAVYKNRTVRENFKVIFEGESEAAEVRLDTDNYGASSNWVLIREDNGSGEAPPTDSTS
jgi:hypothetical protein